MNKGWCENVSQRSDSGKKNPGEKKTVAPLQQNTTQVAEDRTANVDPPSPTNCKQHDKQWFTVRGFVMFHKSQPKILTLCSRLKAGKCTQS